MEEFFHDAAFHLVGGLVGEGHSQDTPICARLAEKQQQIFTGQPMGFSGSGRCTIDGQHIRRDLGMSSCLAGYFYLRIAFFPKDLFYLLAEVALHDDFAVFGRAAHTTFHLE